MEKALLISSPDASLKSFKRYTLYYTGIQVYYINIYRIYYTFNPYLQKKNFKKLKF